MANGKRAMRARAGVPCFYWRGASRGCLFNVLGVALGVGDVGVPVPVSIRNYMGLSSLNPTKQGQIRLK